MCLFIFPPPSPLLTTLLYFSQSSDSLFSVAESQIARVLQLMLLQRNKKRSAQNTKGNTFTPICILSAGTIPGVETHCWPMEAAHWLSGGGVEEDEEDEERRWGDGEEEEVEDDKVEEEGE